MNEWVDYLRQHKPPGVCSLCEVPLSQEQRAKLLAWPSQCKASRLEDHLANDFFDPARGHSAADSLGLTLLWFASLHGREHASEGEIWPPVARQFPEESRAVLFAQGHPRVALKWALESCCNRFELRHAFGRHGGQAYYVTVYLQFGFTRNGLVNLAQWLSGYGRPTAVRILLQESPAFQELWVKLQANESTPENPFWPEGWKGQADEPVQLARLRWSEEGPEFVLQLSRLFPGLEDGSYQVDEPFEFYQVIDGEPNPVSLTCAPDKPELSIALTSLSTGESFYREVLLWNGDLQFWDEHGRLRRQPSTGCSVHVPPGWKIQSPLQRTHERWAQLGSLPLLLEDEEGRVTEWSTLSTGPLQGVALRWQPQTIRSLPQGIEGILQNLPVGTKVAQAEISDYYGSWHVQCELPTDLREPTWPLRLRHQGRIRTIRANLSLDLITWQNDGLWESFEDRGKYDLGKLEHQPFRFLGDFSDYGLLEGHRFLGRPPAGTSLLQGLSGYGAPLLLRKGPFNPLDQPDRRLISSICHQGVLEQVQFENEKYRVSSRIPLTTKHYLLFWDGVHTLRTPHVESGVLPLENPLLVAVGYGSAWLGSFWTRNRPPQQQSNPWLAAHIMRWAHMPLLEYSNQALARHWMRRQELQFVSAWMESNFEGLVHRDDEGWFEVLRGLIPPNLSVTPDQARNLLKLAPWQSWLRIHPKLLEHLLNTGECNREMDYLGRLLQGDLEGRVEREMGVDRGWLQQLLTLYFDGRTSVDLEVALAFPSFQELVLRESLR